MAFDDRAFMLDKSKWPHGSGDHCICCVVNKLNKDWREFQFGFLVDVEGDLVFLLETDVNQKPLKDVKLYHVDKLLEEGWRVD